MAHRTYDYALIHKLRDTGMYYREIAEFVGCSVGTVGVALNPEARKTARARDRKYRRSKHCVDCGMLCTATRCKKCSDRFRAVSVRETELQCANCREWKPDEAFYPWNSRVAAGRRYRTRRCIPCHSAYTKLLRKRRVASGI